MDRHLYTADHVFAIAVDLANEELAIRLTGTEIQRETARLATTYMIRKYAEMTGMDVADVERGVEARLS